MAILVTGGAGYVGSHTVHALSDAGHDIIVVDNLSTGFQAALPDNVRFYCGDIRDRSFLDGVFSSEKIEGVIHFAASSQVGESMNNPLKYYDNNVHGTEVLLESMVAHGIDKIVFSSSAAVYGTPVNIPIREDDSTCPVNCYGETKLAMEQMIRWVANAHRLRFVALRYFNACGAHPSGRIGEAHNPETHLIPIILQTVNGQRPCLSVFGDDYPTPDGSCIRDYIHVCDLAQAHILAFDYLAHGGTSCILNLGSGQGYSVIEVIDAARRITGYPIPFEIHSRRAGDPAALVASPAKAQSVLRWNPQYSDLDTIIASAWKWHCSHPHGFA